MCAHVAQLVERVLGKDEVISSILIVGSTNCATIGWKWQGDPAALPQSNYHEGYSQEKLGDAYGQGEI